MEGRMIVQHCVHDQLEPGKRKLYASRLFPGPFVETRSGAKDWKRDSVTAAASVKQPQQLPESHMYSHTLPISQRQKHE